MNRPGFNGDSNKPRAVQFADCLLLRIREFWVPTTYTTASAGRCKTILGSCDHEGVFKLGEGGNHGEEEFALGGRGVDVLLQHLKRDIVLLQLRRNF